MNGWENRKPQHSPSNAGPAHRHHPLGGAMLIYKYGKRNGRYIYKVLTPIKGRPHHYVLTWE